MLMRYRGIAILTALALAALVMQRGLDAGHWAMTWPKEWQLPFADWLNAVFWFLSDFEFAGSVTGRDLTRLTVPLFQAPTDLFSNLFFEGFTSGFGANKRVLFPPLSWLGLALVVVLGCYRVGGVKLAALGAATAAYLLVFGLWSSAMLTMAQLAVAVPFGLLAGLMAGIWVWRSPRAKPAVLLALDQMQTIPIFAYLVPVVVFFGLGVAPAIIVTVIFALPTMVRTTVVGLEEAARTTGELALSIGCNRRQALWKVILPTAQDTLRVGLNQVVMLSFSSVIIASLVGAGGLGYDVLVALRRLAIGRGLEAGFAITLMAITLNSFLQHYSTGKVAGLPRLTRSRFLALLGALLLGLTLLSMALPWLAVFPKSLVLSTGPFFDNLIEWVNLNLYGLTNGVKTTLLIWFFLPLKRLLTALPWVVVVAAVGIAGVLVGDLKRGLFLAGLALAIAASGLWEKAMLTVYLCSVAVTFAAVVGIPIGIWAGRSRTVARMVMPVIDTLQTLPAFVYLIPAIMLFGTGDFPSFVAIVAYSISPAIRYAELGIRTVPEHLREAGIQFGCNPLQRLWKIELPAASPQILLGLNRTIMLGLSMLIVTALIGTNDLGQETVTALARVDAGRGLAAGFAVAFIAIIADRLVGGLAERMARPQLAGMAATGTG
jgi:glycine betaine/proline transport system permease protein